MTQSRESDFQIEVLYDEVPPGTMDGTSDGRYVFGFEPTPDGRTLLWLNGQRGMPFDEIVSRPDGQPWLISNSGGRFAYAFRRQAKSFVGADDREYGPYDNLSKQIPPFFSPDDRHLVYAALVGEEMQLVIDGSEVPGVTPAAGMPIFSRDGSRLAYVAVRRAGRDYREWVMLDGHAEPEADGIGDGSMVFSPDGVRFAYERSDGPNARYVIDGEADPAFLAIERGEFSPTGSRFAYPAFDGRHMFIVENRQTGPEFKRVSSVIFSADGVHLAYAAAATKTEWYVVVDGVPGPLWHDMWSNPTFSRDGKHVAYLAEEVTGGVLRRRRMYRAVVDGSPGRGFDEVRYSPQFAPDGRLAFVARLGEAWSVVVGDEPGQPFEWVTPPVWSSSGRLGYMAGSGAAAAAVIDGVVGPQMNTGLNLEGLPITFSPDGRHVAYIGTFDGDLRVVVDGRISPVMNGVDHPVFGEGSVSFLGIHEARVVRLRVALG